MANKSNFGLYLSDPVKSEKVQGITGLHQQVDYGQLKADRFSFGDDPWQEGIEGEVTYAASEEARESMNKWEIQFASNSEEAAAEYGDLTNRKYGYSYDTMSTSRQSALPGQGSAHELVLGADIPQRRGMDAGQVYRAESEYVKTTTNLGKGEKATSYRRTGSGAPKGRAAWESGESAMRNTVNVDATGDLSDLEEYKLYRYERQLAMTDGAIGQGEIDYDFLDDVGYGIAHKAGASLGQAQRQRGPALGGGGLDRSRRQKGKAKFKSGLQL